MKYYVHFYDKYDTYNLFPFKLYPIVNLDELHIVDESGYIIAMYPLIETEPEMAVDIPGE